MWNGTTPAGPSLTSQHGANITNGGADDLRPGDLIMLTRGAASALVMVTSVAGQVVTFGTGAHDTMNLNQMGAPTARPGSWRRRRTRTSTRRPTR